MRTLLRRGAEDRFFLRLTVLVRWGGPWSSGTAVCSVTVLMKLAVVFCWATGDAVRCLRQLRLT